MTIAISVLGGIAVMAIFLGISGALVSIKESAGTDSVRVGNPIVNSPAGPWVISIAKYIGKRFERYCKRLDEKLVYAGRPGGDLTGAEFFATLIIGVLGVYLVLVAVMAVNSALTVGALIFLLFFSAILFMLGIAWLDSEVSGRRVSISRDFPYFMDLSVMTLEAGSDFRETLEIYIKDNSEKALAEEFAITLSEMKMGSIFQEAIGGMVDRVSAEEVRNSLRALLQGERMGTPIGQLFRDQADAIRFRRSQLAERAAEEMKVKLQGPTMMLMMSVLLLILGPAIINIFSSEYF